VKILYFAWLRSNIGVSEEILHLPQDVVTLDHPVRQDDEVAFFLPVTGG